jgi:hypothetical protein
MLYNAVIIGDNAMVTTLLGAGVDANKTRNGGVTNKIK